MSGAERKNAGPGGFKGAGKPLDMSSISVEGSMVSSDDTLVFFKPAGALMRRGELMRRLVSAKPSLVVVIEIQPSFVDTDPSVFAKADVAISLETVFTFNNSDEQLPVRPPAPLFVLPEPKAVVGAAVSAKYGQQWYPAKLTAINADGSAQISWDAGGTNTQPAGAWQLTELGGEVPLSSPAYEALLADMDKNGSQAVFDSTTPMTNGEVPTLELTTHPAFRTLLALRTAGGVPALPPTQVALCNTLLGQYSQVTKQIIDLDKYDIIDPAAPAATANPAAVADPAPPADGTVVNARPRISQADVQGLHTARTRLQDQLRDWFSQNARPTVKIAVNALLQFEELAGLIEGMFDSASPWDVQVAQLVGEVVRSTIVEV